ncbi:helix-turn-helix domain-containing protein [Streptomyces similanensis]
MALETGFSSAVQFYRAFRTATGMTPSEYREAAVTEGPAAAVVPDLET